MASAAAERAAAAAERLAADAAPAVSGAARRGHGALDAARASLRGVTASLASLDVAVDPMAAWQLRASLTALPEKNPALAGVAAAVATAATPCSSRGSPASAPRASAMRPRRASRRPSPCPRAFPLPTTGEGIRAYWRARPLASLRRTSALLVRVQPGASACCRTSNRPAPRRWSAMVGRIQALSRDLIAEQGPAFVKVGQAVAIRPDLLPPAYLTELQTLLDQVAPFGSDEARALIRQQLGAGDDLEDAFEDASARHPGRREHRSGVRARGSRRTGTDNRPRRVCPLPVRRRSGGEGATTGHPGDGHPRFAGDPPAVLSAVASVISKQILAQIKQGAEGFLPVLDVAAERFLEELDYGLEADNASRFEKDMASVEVVRGRRCPTCSRGLSGRCVLTQEWVEGRKLTDITSDPSTGPLRAKLVQTLLNSYMVQFLETGFLHADPHPGNFLLMPDGRLCILDYGMMTEILPDQRDRVHRVHRAPLRARLRENPDRPGQPRVRPSRARERPAQPRRGRARAGGDAGDAVRQRRGYRGEDR